MTDKDSRAVDALFGQNSNTLQGSRDGSILGMEQISKRLIIRIDIGKDGTSVMLSVEMLEFGNGELRDEEGDRRQKIVRALVDLRKELTDIFAASDDTPNRSEEKDQESDSHLQEIASGPYLNLSFAADDANLSNFTLFGGIPSSDFPSSRVTQQQESSTGLSFHSTDDVDLSPHEPSPDLSKPIKESGQYSDVGSKTNFDDLLMAGMASQEQSVDDRDVGHAPPLHMEQLDMDVVSQDLPPRSASEFPQSIDEHGDARRYPDTASEAYTDSGAIVEEMPPDEERSCSGDADGHEYPEPMSGLSPIGNMSAAAEASRGGRPKLERMDYQYEFRPVTRSIRRPKSESQKTLLESPVELLRTDEDRSLTKTPIQSFNEKKGTETQYANSDNHNTFVFIGTSPRRPDDGLVSRNSPQATRRCTSVCALLYEFAHNESMASEEVVGTADATATTTVASRERYVFNFTMPRNNNELFSNFFAYTEVLRLFPTLRLSHVTMLTLPKIGLILVQMLRRVIPNRCVLDPEQVCPMVNLS